MMETTIANAARRLVGNGHGVEEERTSTEINRHWADDPVVARYDCYREAGASLAETIRAILPVVQQHPRPLTHEAVEGRLRIAADFNDWMRAQSYEEVVYLAYDLLPIEADYPGWVMAGVDAELLLVLLRQELEILQNEVGAHAPGADELATAIRLTKSLRWLTASTLREPERTLKPADYHEAHACLHELETLARHLPIKRETFADIIQLIHSIKRDLDAGDEPLGALLSMAPEVLLATGMALERLQDDEQPELPISPGHLTKGDCKCARFSYGCELKPDSSKLDWKITIGGEVPIEKIPDILASILEVLEAFFILLGKGLSSLVLFWLFYDDDDDEQHQPRKVLRRRTS